MKKKVLLIAYYWPPAGGAGVQRWLKMSKFIAEHCDLTVFSPKNAAYPIEDEILCKDISPKIKHIQSNIWEPYAWAKKVNPKSKQYQKGQIEPREKQSLLAKISLWIRANIFIPDSRMLWIPTAVKSIQKQLDLNTYDAIISTGPPHTCHLIAQKIKQKYPRLQWLADFRDPWTNIDYFSQLPLTQPALKYHRYLEKKVVKSADIVTTVSPAWAKEFEDISGRKVNVVYNGFDEADFKNLSVEKNQDKFILTYVGSLNSDRNPSLLWQVLNEKCKDIGFKKDFRLKLIGTVAQEVKAEIKTFDLLKENTEFIPYLSHNDAIKELSKSAVLLLLINDTPNKNGMIPGKFFEYMATHHEILCIGDEGLDIDKIMQEISCGKVIHRKDRVATQNYINDLYERFCKNELDLLHNKNISKYSRESAAKNIMNLLNL